MAVFGSDEVQFFALLGLDHLPFQEMIIFKFPVGGVMRVGKNYRTLGLYLCAVLLREL